MAVQTKSELKTYFQAGSAPTSQQFESLIDSLRHESEPLGIDQVAGLSAAISDPQKFKSYLEALPGSAPGKVLTMKDDGIGYDIITEAPAAVASGNGIRIIGPGVAGSPAVISSLANMRRFKTNGGAQDIVIPHGLTNISAESPVSVTPNSLDATGYSYAQIDETNVTICYAGPTVPGLDNLVYTITIYQIFS